METKKEKIVSAVATIGIVLMLFGATYAYFASRTDAGKTTDVEITANTVDVLTFETGDPITLSLDQENFASGKGNQSGSTFAKATLSANNKTNTATEHYYVYLYIEENTFVRTNDDGVPEILLRVTKNGTEITDGDYIDNFDYNGTNLTGYDFTDAEGLIPIAYNEEITTTSTTEDVWNVEITFVNHDFDQSANAGQSFKGRIIIQKNEIGYHDLCDEDLLACYVAKKYTGNQGDDNIYYHNGTILNDEGTIMDAEDYSYRYAGAYEDVNNYVCFGSDDETCPVDNLYRIVGVFDGKVKLIKTTWTSAATGTLDFTTCTSSMPCFYILQKYKEEMKPISIGAYWNYTNATTAYNETGYYNVWSYSVLNTGFLNGEYLNNFDTKWSDKIATTDWIVGGAFDANTNAKVAYTNEIINPSTEVKSTYQSKVGLMYVSDYYYGATPTYWTNAGNDSDETKDYRAATGSNWMYVGLYEWTITRDSSSNFVGVVSFEGDFKSAPSNNASAVSYVRPVFYLNSDVTRASGDGTRSLPFRLSD